MKNTSLSSKDTTLISVLQGHFSNELNLARVKLICLFITALCKIKTINYDKPASAFDTKVAKNRSYRRIQRFMKEYNFSNKTVSTLIFKLLPSRNDFVLILDRTNWKFGSKDINILMLGISYKDIAFPLMFNMLDKRGNSDMQERIDLIKQYVELFGKHTIDCLLADREFIGDRWLQLLNEIGIRYYIRIRNNFKAFSYQKQEFIDARWLFNHLKVGDFYHYPRIVELHGQKCYLAGSKAIGKDGKPELLMVGSFNKHEQAMIYYKPR